MVRVDTLFDVLCGSNLELTNLEQDPNGVNFIARTSANNGVMARIKPLSTVAPNPANTISVAVSGSVMESFLQEEPYYSSYHLFTLRPKIALTDRQMLFYCMCLRANRYKYSYGRQANKTLATLKIPSVEEIPTWVDTIVMPSLPKKSSVSGEVVTLDFSVWRPFLLNDLFAITRGEAEYIADAEAGAIPYISATANNNGISHYVKAANSVGNRITLSFDGTIGEAFYQPKEFFASEKVAVLELKNKELNPYLAMFLITILRAEGHRYNYGYKWSIDTRMKKTRVKLPSDKQGNPDWQLMEAYIKSLSYSSNLV